MDQLIALFTGTLFDWSRSWGFTSSDFIPLFLDSRLICTYFAFFLVCLNIFLLLHSPCMK